jgi:Cu-Zn family superoxide dismutase
MNYKALVAAALLIAIGACERGNQAEENARTAEGPVASGADVTNSVEIRNAQGEVLGHAQVSEEADGIRFALQLTGLAPGSTHGVHVHEKGACDPPAFESAGGHFNPTQRVHGFADPNGPHLGDLPNITADENGQIVTNVIANGVTRGTEQTGLRRPGGTALVVHENPDDYLTNPSGNSGARIACGVISQG